jgi:glycosyltransferase involved in cell wall biosynthesis
MGLSAILITLNEADQLEACLRSVNFCDEVIVIDSGSTDDTVAIAKRYAGKVMVRPFDNFSNQKNFAMVQATQSWVLSIDADERITPSLAVDIQQVVRNPHNMCEAYRFPRHNFIFGRRFRYGANRDDRPIRLFQQGKARFLGEIHEVLSVDGQVGELASPMLHYSTPSMADYLRKCAQYTDLEAHRMTKEGKRFSWALLFGMPPYRFLKTYVWQKGFLDGFYGFVFCLLSGYYELVRILKLYKHRGSL